MNTRPFPVIPGFGHLSLLAALIFGLACHAYADDDDDLALDTGPADRWQNVEEMVVTGSRLPGNEPAGLITIDRDAIERSGAATLSGLIRDLPIAASGTIDEQFTQGFAPASASVNLRGLGVSRTLVLLNGRRLPIFPFAEGGSESFVDLNLIPLGSIERIEIVKDGASAIYGADAVAGVVNIITRDIGGIETTARVSSSAEADGEEVYLSLASAFDVGDSHFNGGVEFFEREAILARDRDLPSTANGPIDARSQVGNPGTAITSLGPVPDAACPASSLSGPFCLYDFAPEVTLIPGVERIGAFADWDHALTDTTGLFARVMYSQSESERDLAAAPNAYPVSAANPNNPFGEDVLALYRLTDLGPRRDRFETDSLTLVGGVTGVVQNWQWELGFGATQTDTTITGINGYAFAADIQDAINTGVLNPFGPNPGFDPASVSARTTRDGESDLTFADFRANGSFALGGVTVTAAFGLETRREEFSESFDDASEAGQVIGVGGISADGDRTVNALYAEFGLPLGERAEIVVAGRYDDYSDFGGTFNPKLSGSWSVTDTLTLAASIATGFKAPALHELYAGDITSFNAVFDTTQCEAARSAGDTAGITQYCDTVQEIRNVASGNPDLDAEESDTFTFGAEWQALENWVLNLDYWRIDNENAVIASPQFYLDNEARFADNVIRNGAGDVSVVLSPFQNVAAQELWGIDASTTVDLVIPKVGLLKLNGTVAHLGSFEQAPSPGEPTQELAGIDGTPDWRAQASVDWIRDQFAVGVNVNYVGSYERPTANSKVDDFTRVNLQGSWTPEFMQGGNLSIGIDNVFDEAPPEDPFLSGWPFFNRALHDIRGRFAYLSYTQRIR
ncbi:MAG: TonB-dependent receptor [Pseudomonadota bacterium]